MALGILAEVGTARGAALWAVCCAAWVAAYLCLQVFPLRQCGHRPLSPVTPQEPPGPPGPKPSAVIQAPGDTRTWT